jgi:hypothetical protein
MTSSVTTPVKASVLIALGLATAGMGVYVLIADDAPGTALLGFLLMLAAVFLWIRTVRSRLPVWAARIALAAGVLIAAATAIIIHAVTVAGPLFAQPPDIPSVNA